MVRAPHYIEIACGCTNNQLEESVGILRISDDDTIVAICYCNDVCNGVEDQGFVFNCNSEKIKLGETSFLRNYKEDEYVRPHSHVLHRDEFLSCTACPKVRRFELRTRDACRTYHDAASRDMIPSNEVDMLKHRGEELGTHGGCRRNSKCKGYELCVCFGCQMCRFEDCGCQVC
ncbi:putative developmental regulator, ULTRAPETALA [Helianthus annuus]|nr:putative developmental regulator, ULTRAPETALA [Helianthus annuus]